MLESLLMSRPRSKWDVTFLGENPPSEVISGPNLADMIGLTAGTAINGTSGWLKFEVGDKQLYIAKMPFLYNLSWDHIAAVDAVLSENIYQYNELLFRVRLMTGGDRNPASGPGGEWDNVLARVIEDGDLGNYSLADIGLTGPGRLNWMQEGAIQDPSQKVRRGDTSFHHFDYVASDLVNSDNGWRPVLELVSPDELLYPVTRISYSADYINAVRPYYWGYTD